MLFTPERYPLGDVVLGQKLQTSFERVVGEEFKNIQSITLYCGCISYELNQNEIRVWYQAPHMLPDGVVEANETSYEVEKFFQVVFEDDTYEFHYITAIVHKDSPVPVYA